MPWSQFINLALLREITDGDRDTEERFVRLYLKNMHEGLEKLRMAMERGNTGEWAQTMHTLKGASANIYAERMRALCQHAESLANPQAQKRVLQEMEAEIRAYRQALGEPPR